MAGVSHNGSTAIDPDLGWDLAAELFGNDGSGIPWKQWTAGGLGGQPDWHDPFQFLASGGANTPDGGGGAKPAGTARAGADEARRTSFSRDWHEHIHIIPRVKIDFGNIITQVEEDYEVYSAFRDDETTLATIINNATPGIELPNVSAPLQVPKQTSILDPTSTGNGSGTGLGTLVKTVVRALQDGLPTFDTNILFNFNNPANDVELLIAGIRIVLIPMEYEAPTTEILAFLTDVIEALDGKEQRIALRLNPRQMFRVTYALDLNDRQRMQALLFDWMDNAFGFPLWHEKLLLTASVSAGATVYQVQGADDVDLRVGGLAVVISDAATFDVINIVSKTDTTITAADPSVNAYPAGTPIMPVRTAVIRRAVPGRRSINNLETFQIEFEVTDNTTGAIVGDTTPGFWSLFQSRVLFDDCNVVSGDIQETFNRRVYLIDNSTGKIALSSTWDRNKRTHPKGFVLRSRAEIISFRKVLIALAGSQKAFYIPNFIEDLTAKAGLTIGTATIDVESIEYVRLVRNRFPMNLFRITFTDDTSLIRTIISSATIDSTTERLTLDTTWPATRPLSEIRRIEFYDLVRFATDEFEITYPRIGLAECVAPVQRVFDDN